MIAECSLLSLSYHSVMAYNVGGQLVLRGTCVSRGTHGPKTTHIRGTILGVGGEGGTGDGTFSLVTLHKITEIPANCASLSNINVNESCSYVDPPTCSFAMGCEGRVWE